jgi:gliding motility-associated-like protein
MNIDNKYSGFEKLLKNKFSNFEAPYNHKDWEDFKKDLPKSSTSFFSPKNLLKFLIIAAAIVLPIVAILHFTSNNENTKGNISINKQVNNHVNSNNNQDQNTQLNNSENNISDNKTENHSSQTILNINNSSLDNPNTNQKENSQTKNLKNSFTNNTNKDKNIKDKSNDNFKNSNSFNEELIYADVDEGCAPLKVQFEPLISSDTVSYLWTFGDGKTSTKTAPSHIFNNEGSYNVSLTVIFAKSKIKRKIAYTININVREVPIAKFDYSLDPQSDIISFADNSTGAVSWEWTFGDNSSSSDTNPQHEYKQNGTYGVQLTVKNVFGCSDTYTKKVAIKLKDLYFIPNSFSPNGDGQNDYFGPVGTDLNSVGYTFLIYNKNGMLVFETNDINTKWDGKIKGSNADAQPDIYFWKIKMKDKNGNLQERSGYVTLLKFEQ